MTDPTERQARKIALITGASRGIGRAIALRLAPAYDLILTARSENELQALAAECTARGAKCHTLALDLTDAAAIASALADVAVDVLVNNAGTAVMRPLLDLTPAEWHRMVDVNINALFHVTRAVLPGMVARGHGHVCTIGSIAGRNAFVGGAAYAGTKHFVMGFSESLMLEVRDRGVSVSVIMPGSVDTALFPPETDRTWMLHPDDVAEAVHFVLSTPKGVLVHRLEVRPLSTKRPR